MSRLIGQLPVIRRDSFKMADHPGVVLGVLASRFATL